jgi:hypothetical protein
MERWIKAFPHRGKPLDLLIAQKPFTLLPDHLYPLPYCGRVLVSVLQRQLQVR